MRLTRRCYAVTGLAYLPPWTVNAGFITGAHTTLIVDTGTNTLSAQTIHGYASAAAPGNALRVIDTERHFDHIGGNSYFRSQGIDVLGHPLLRREPAEFAAERAEYASAISNGARREANEEAWFYAGTELANPNLALDGEGPLDLGDCIAQVIFTPGHTPTNLCVYVPEERVLYAGDCLIHGYLPNLDAGGPAEWREWLASLDRLARLELDYVVCGHGPVASGAQVTGIIARVREVLNAALASGRSPTS